MQSVEEVPSSSASSVAPSAATPPAAAKTAALIQAFNDEQEPGWIFGVMGGSVESVTTGTDNLWDESLCWTVDQCRQHVRMRGVRTSV